MNGGESANLQALVFKNRGLLLALPAAALLIFGRPDLFSITLGLPLAVIGELVRCWAVGYSGVTTRNDVVTAPQLITAGPYGYVRNPLYLGNFITAAGFAIAFTGGNASAVRTALIVGCLACMLAVYVIVVAHEERFLRGQFGERFEAYCARVPRIVPQLRAPQDRNGSWRPSVLVDAESKTFAIFAAMIVALFVRLRIG
ncbi:MAG: isoprenylcysteine carboxylmethyltransferase family protein [Candidatus Eremiobacteraeota bacterium]|nr:isoprenylcysteine carboxylmethyltransferase family protein [Candidatus Eremiobacteraeota bacterium]